MGCPCDYSLFLHSSTPNLSDPTLLYSPYYIGGNDSSGTILVTESMVTMGRGARNGIQHTANRAGNYFCTHCKIAGHSLERCLKANKLLCSYCNLPSHNIDKCYKIHGYPPSQNFHNRGKFLNSSTNQVTGTIMQEPKHTEISGRTQSPITQEQYHQLIGLLNKQNVSTPAYVANQVRFDMGCPCDNSLSFIIQHFPTLQARTLGPSLYGYAQKLEMDAHNVW